MKSVRLVMAAAAMAMAMAGAANAATLLPTTVTVNGATYGNPAVLNDGVFPADGASYQNGTVHSFADSTVFVFSFGTARLVEGFKLNVDNNDDYIVTLFGSASTLTRTIRASDGIINSGVETFSSDPSLSGRYAATLAFAPFTATRATVQARGGDGYYGIGEAQFFGNVVTAGVPEPATWAMLLLGFGAVGALQRRTRGLRIRYPSIV